MRPLAYVLCLLASTGIAVAQDSAASREFTVFVTLADAPGRAVGREFTVYNEPLDTDVRDRAVSREFTVTSGVSGLPADLAVSREFSAYVVPYTFPEAIVALRRAAGLNATTPSDMNRLNVVTEGPSATVLDVLDASRAADLAAHADPDL